MRGKWLAQVKIYKLLRQWTLPEPYDSIPHYVPFQARGGYKDKGISDNSYQALQNPAFCGVTVCGATFRMRRVQHLSSLRRTAYPKSGTYSGADITFTINIARADRTASQARHGIFIVTTCHKTSVVKLKDAIKQILKISIINFLVFISFYHPKQIRCKTVYLYAMKAWRGEGGSREKDPLNLNLETRKKRVINFTSRPLYPR